MIFCPGFGLSPCYCTPLGSTKFFSSGLQGKRVGRCAGFQAGCGGLQEDKEEWRDSAFLSTRGERWLILDHPNLGGEGERAMESPGSCGLLW